MQRLRKRVKRKIVVGVSVVVIQIFLLGVCWIAVGNNIEKKYEALLTEQETLLKTAERTVYITVQEIKAGECFTGDNVEKRYVLCEQNPETIATDIIGMFACADMPVGAIVSTSLCSAPGYAETERECVFDNIGCVENFASYDAVDVRIRYANGENYCVLKKKRLQREAEDVQVCRFLLSEEEQLLMSAAQYDVEVYDGAELYVVGFIEERLQKDAVSEYLPSIQVLSQLNECNAESASSTATKHELRLELEQRLKAYRMQQREGLL